MFIWVRLVLAFIPLSSSVTFVAVGQSGTILKTTDGGATWTDMPNPYQGTSTLYKGVHFVNAQTGYVVGDPPSLTNTHQNGIILKTIDGGST